MLYCQRGVIFTVEIVRDVNTIADTKRRRPPGQAAATADDRTDEAGTALDGTTLRGASPADATEVAATPGPSAGPHPWPVLESATPLWSAAANQPPPTGGRTGGGRGS